MHTGGDGLLPWFACIEKIVSVPAKTSTHVFFVLKEIQTLNYESHMHAYRVRVQNGAGITVLSQAELTTLRPLHVCTVIGDNAQNTFAQKLMLMCTMSRYRFKVLAELHYICLFINWLSVHADYACIGQ